MWGAIEWNCFQQDARRILAERVRFLGGLLAISPPRPPALAFGVPDGDGARTRLAVGRAETGEWEQAAGVGTPALQCSRLAFLTGAGAGGVWRREGQRREVGGRGSRPCGNARASKLPPYVFRSAREG